MTIGEKLRKQNKHRKIVLKRCITLGESFTVSKVVNTTDVLPRARMDAKEIEAFIDRGFTVEITS